MYVFEEFTSWPTLPKLLYLREICPSIVRYRARRDDISLTTTVTSLIIPTRSKQRMRVRKLMGHCEAKRVVSAKPSSPPEKTRGPATKIDLRTTKMAMRPPTPRVVAQDSEADFDAESNASIDAESEDESEDESGDESDHESEEESEKKARKKSMRVVKRRATKSEEKIYALSQGSVAHVLARLLPRLPRSDPHTFFLLLRPTTTEQLPLSWLVGTEAYVEGKEKVYTIPFVEKVFARAAGVGYINWPAFLTLVVSLHSSPICTDLYNNIHNFHSFFFGLTFGDHLHEIIAGLNGWCLDEVALPAQSGCATSKSVASVGFLMKFNTRYTLHATTQLQLTKQRAH
ncbi:hypothetical protein GQ600_1308 [Phytophthora cactorum]|nr:hypothetical protein GQ600_1308 [Phytophthora cactorum]